ncbi:immunoglobulin-like domain-containing protein [Haloplasma contractile]|uniref:Chitinase protein n=1 Tax=Haloplasma contractile SSD-17B TaxID=1033810 RepID=U2E8C3_9MOLU|nr:immunoglobulin-like domain-containing protein [Haloplasma contractile]ERJ11141.1 chitinase protein [Haloplasma contractile SSD-17B]
MFRQNKVKMIGMLTLLLAISFITIDTPNVLAKSISVNASIETNEEGYSDLGTAIEAASSGDVIYLHPGVYQLPKTVLDKSLDFKRFGQGTVKIIPSNNLQEGEPWIHVTLGSKVTFDRIIFDGNSKDIATLIDASGYIEVTNSIIKNISDQYGDGVGIIVQNGGLIYENEFSQLGSMSVVITGDEQTKIIENNFIGKSSIDQLDIAILIKSQGDTVITGNHISNHAGTVSEREDQLKSSALYIENIPGDLSGTITIKENMIKDNQNALIVGSLKNNNLTIKMNNNSIINNESTITNLDTEFYIEGRMNYYGPSPAGPDGITGLVHYFPWAMSSDYKKVVNNKLDVIIVDDDYETYRDYTHVAYDPLGDDETEHYYYGVNAFSNLNEAVENAIEGSTIFVEGGVYELDQTLVIDKGVTLKGVNQDTVIVNASNLKNHGIYIANENVGEVELSGFTLIGTNTNHSGIYAFGTRQLNLHHILIQEFLKNGIELNAVRDATMNNLTSINNGKNGIEIANSRYVTIDRVTTSLNGFRGLGVIREDATFYGIDKPDYITVKHIEALEGGIYLENNSVDNDSISYRITEDDPQASVTILSDEIEYAYHGFHIDDAYHTIFLKNENETQPYLNNSHYTSIYLKNLVANRFTVTDDMDIMDTLNEAKSGDEIFLSPGVHYIPKVTIDRAITFRGASSGESILKLYEHTDLGEAYIEVVKAGVSFHSITFDGSTTNIYTAVNATDAVSVIDSFFKGIRFGDLFGTAIQVKSGGVIKGNRFESIGRTGILVDSPVGTITKLLNNTYIGKNEGTWLDYGIDVRQFGELLIEGNSFNECIGMIDSVHSSGIKFSASEFVGTVLHTIQYNSFNGNTNAIVITENVPSDVKLNIHYNVFSHQKKNLVNDSQALVNATLNYYGTGAKQPDPKTMVGDVNYFPWVSDATYHTPVNDSIRVLIVDQVLGNSSNYDLVRYDTNNDGEDEDYYVGVNAFSTVKDAVHHTQNGSKVFMIGGTYAIENHILIENEIQLLGIENQTVSLDYNNQSSIKIKASNIVISNITFKSKNGFFTPILIDLYDGMSLPHIKANKFKDGASIAFVLNNQTLQPSFIENLISNNDVTSYSYLLTDSDTLKEQPVYKIYPTFSEGFNAADLGDRMVFKEGPSSEEEEIRIGELIDSFLSEFILTHDQQVIDLRGKINTDTIQYHYKLNDDEWKLYQDDFVISTAGLNTLEIEARDEDGDSLTVYEGTIVIISHAPDLSNLNDLTVQVNHIIDYIFMQDSLRGMSYIDEIIVDDEKVELTEVGSYDVTYTVRDLLGNEQSATITVNVVDPLAPTISVTHLVLNSSDFQDISIVDNERIIELLELNTYIKDNYDEAPTIYVEQLDLGVNFSKLGVYSIKGIATDSSGNVTEQMIKVIVTDQTEPEVTFKQDSFELFTENIDWLSYCNVSDDYFSRDQLEVRLINSTVNINKVGSYQLTIGATDPLGNTLEKTIDIQIVDTKAPNINGLKKEQIIKVGDEFDPIGHLTFVDEGTEDLSEYIEVFGDYDVNEPGEYTITILVQDESGNYTIQTYMLIVEQNTWKVILMGAGGFLALIAVIIILQALRSRNERKEEVLLDRESNPNLEDAGTTEMSTLNQDEANIDYYDETPTFGETENASYTVDHDNEEPLYNDEHDSDKEKDTDNDDHGYKL